MDIYDMQCKYLADRVGERLTTDELWASYRGEDSIFDIM
jgi:hypothetical protein